ncbi:TM2 domain-containing protein, partial [bacterium]|nr:TM2 domain-containing protein [bacterium]
MPDKSHISRMRGHPMSQQHEPSREKAVKLALTLGWAGGHRFYTKQTFSGLAYLLFCWTLIPGLLSLIDAAFLARMSDEDFADEFCSLPNTAATA